MWRRPGRSKMPSSDEKWALLRLLTQERHRTDPKALFGSRYSSVRDFFDEYDCDDHVSPFSKSAQNVDASVMLVAQDWSSEDRLNEPYNHHRALLGYDPDVTFNNHLQRLLRTHFAMCMQRMLSHSSNQVQRMHPSPFGIWSRRFEISCCPKSKSSSRWLSFASEN